MKAAKPANAGEKQAGGQFRPGQSGKPKAARNRNIARTAPAPTMPISLADAAVVERHRARVQERPALPSLKDEFEDGVHRIGNSHADHSVGSTIIADALGSIEGSFVEGLLSQIIQATGRGTEPNMDAANFMLAAIKGIAPKDEAESMLAVQMAATHMLAMKVAASLANPSATATIDHMNGYASRLTKLTRTFTMQMDALKRYRTGGEQKVTVQHVNVNDGGQAIVGDVTPVSIGRG